MVITLALFTGCSTEKTAEPVVITTATSFGGDSANAPMYKERLAQFATNNPLINVHDSSAKADDDWKSQIRSGFQSGTEDDIMFFFSGSDVKSFIDNNKLVSLDQIREVYPNYASNIKPEVLDNMREYDGNVYAVPIMGFWEGLFCNEELFRENDIPMITDWDSLIYAIKAFNENGITPIAASFFDIPNYWIEHLVLSTGGVSVHSENPKTPSEVPAEWVEGLDLLAELYTLDTFQVDCLSTKHELAIGLYKSGQAAMILEGSWLGFDGDIEKSTRVVRFPSADGVAKNEQGVISGFSMGFYISTKAWNDPAKRDACVKYVEFMTNNESIQELCVQGAPAADIQIQADDSKIKQDGVAMCNGVKMQMPIDSRLGKGAWEYLASKITAIAEGKLTSAEVLAKAADMNN